MADEYLVALQATIDDSSISNLNTKIDGLTNKLNPIELKINTSNVESKIKDIRKQIEDLSKIKIDLGQGKTKGGTATVNQQTKAMKELLSIANQIDKLTLKAGGMKSSIAGLNAGEIERVQAELKKLYDTYRGLAQKISSGSSIKKSDLENYKTQITDTKQKLVQFETQLTSMQSKLVTGIKTDIGNGKMGSQIADIEARFRSLGVESQEVNSNIQLLKTLMSQMDSSDDIESVVADYKQFQQILIQTTNQVKTLKREQATNTANIKLSNAKASLSSDIDLWLKNNSAAAKKFGAELSNIQAQIKSADATQLSNLKAQFQDVKKQAQLAGVAGKTMGDQFKQSIKTVGNYLSAAMLISRAVMTMRNMYNEVLKVDTAMTGLKRVTNLTGEEYTKMYDDMTESAKKYGSTLEDIINSTASWVRLGFDAQTAEKLSEVSAMYQHVTDLDENTAVTNLVTAYKGYQDELLKLSDGDEVKAMTRVSDIYDKLGNEMPVTAAQVGEGMTKAASVMEMAGATIEEAAGMITGGGAVTQDFNAFGNALKVSALRIRGKTFCLHI